MKAVLLFALLIGLAAANLVLNFVVPNSLKLVLVPAITLVVIVLVTRRLRRPG